MGGIRLNRTRRGLKPVLADEGGEVRPQHSDRAVDGQARRLGGVIARRQPGQELDQRWRRGGQAWGPNGGLRRLVRGGGGGFGRHYGGRWIADEPGKTRTSTCLSARCGLVSSPVARRPIYAGQVRGLTGSTPAGPIASNTMRTLRWLAGPFFIFAGAMHFIRPRFYLRIMPPYVPAHEAMVYASGAAELAGGVGLMVPRLRRRAGWWLIATREAGGGQIDSADARH